MNKIVFVLSGVILVLFIMIGVLFERTLSLKGKLESKEANIELLRANLYSQNKALEKLKLQTKDYKDKQNQRQKEIKAKLEANIPKENINCEKILDYVIHVF